MNYINTVTNEYPIQERDIRALFPDTGFPVPFVPPAKYAPVLEVVPPTFDPLRQYAVQVTPVLVSEGRYEQRFVIKPLPGDVIAVNIAGQKTQLTKQFEQAIQVLLDTSAQVERYDSISTVISYAEEPAVAKFQKDGKRFRAWRSLVWDYAYTQLNLVLTGKREQPTIEEFLNELPALELPA